ncbi:chitinase, GH19 family [Chitinispirillum alkaliphilum]|nr:chitinase, GH19 family [Chitinispirillum alkaliphilum]
MRRALFLVFFASQLFAADIPVITNVDATVTFSSGSNSITETFSGGDEKTVRMPWLTSTASVTVSAVSNHVDHLDTVYEARVEVPTTYPAWQSDTIYEQGDTVTHIGLNWACLWWTQGEGDEPTLTPSGPSPWKNISDGPVFKLHVTLPRKPYSTDTAYVPVSGNTSFTLRAIPLSMEEGGNPPSMDFSIEKGVADTIRLPVRTDFSRTVNTSRYQSSSEISLRNANGRINLTLPPDFYKSHLQVFSINGRRVINTSINSKSNASFSVWDVPAGKYILRLTSISGSDFTQNITHMGGDLRIFADFNAPVSINASRFMASGMPTSASAQYRFEAIPTEPGFADSVMTISLTGQLQDPIVYRFVNPEVPSTFLMQLMDSTLYEEFFPNRYGLGFGAYTNPNETVPDDPSQITRLPSDGDYDFFTFRSFLNAVDSMANIEVELYVAKDRNGRVAPGCSRLIWRNKRTGETREFKTHPGYDETVQYGSEMYVGKIDYALFCNEGSLSVRRHELAAFLANISHETTGAANTNLDRTWGLYWREEVAWQNGSTQLGYVDQFTNPYYPPSPGQSYHGRGPIQVTHNVNYGQLSEFLYGDKNILLNNPGILVPDKPEDATVAFMSAIWFWMTPQAPKPSCHDVMVGNWVPTPDDIAKNRHTSKFGMTVNIINGGLECGRVNDDRVNSRIAYYRRYIEILGETPEEKCDCEDMVPY